MEDKRILFKTAKLAKEKGFDESCSFVFENGVEKFLGLIQRKNTTYENIFTAPTQSLLQTWLRKTHNINIWVSSKTTDKGNTIFIPHGRTIPDTIKKNLVVDIIVYNTFESHEDACLLYTSDAADE